MGRVYLDHAATTAPDARVLAAMADTAARAWGNPSSIYQEGQQARHLLDEARKRCATLLGASPREIIFTSGGTEADNAAIRGAAFAQRERGFGAHIVTTQVEHHAVLHTFEQLEREGFSATYVRVDGEGRVRLDDLEQAVRPDTVLLSVMAANNEVGTLQPVAEAAALAKRINPRVIVHTDAVQAAGAVDIRPDVLGVDLLSLSAHKFYGPKGVGLLYARARTPFQPLILGGSQERERRAGTEDVAGAVGMSFAMQLAWDEFDVRVSHSVHLRDRLLMAVPERISDIIITGPLDPAARLANNFSCCISGVQGETVLLALDLDGFSASSGSACTTGSLEPSHVLTAMGIDEELARASLRLTVGHENTDEEITRLIDGLEAIVGRLRALG